MTEFFFFSVLFIIGGLVLYEDFKKSRIRNSFILVLILAGIVLNYSLGIFSNQLFPFLINISFGVLIGLVIWFAGLWSAADAKLYISLVFLFPITWFRSSSGYFPGMNILINSTLPLSLLLVGQVLLRSGWGEKNRAARRLFKMPLLFNVFAISAGTILLRNIVNVFLKIQTDYFLTLPLFLLIFWLADRLKVKMVYFFTIIVVLSLVFFPQMNDLVFFASILIFTSLILFIMWIVYLAQPLMSYQVKISELREGAILNEVVLKKDKVFIKQPLAFLTFLTSINQRIKSKPIFGYNPDGLQMSEISEIKNLSEDGRLNFETLGVAKTLPFAYALLSGTIITYFLGDSFLTFI